MMSILILLLLGLVAGYLSGLVGIGGGIIIVPILVYFFSFSQHKAQGTTLFLFMIPVGFLAVYNYYQKDQVDYKTALIMAITFIVGSYFGSKTALAIDTALVKKIFGAVIFVISIKMMLGK
jgi:uncharacterized protein